MHINKNTKLSEVLDNSDNFKAFLSEIEGISIYLNKTNRFSNINLSHYLIENSYESKNIHDFFEKKQGTSEFQKLIQSALDKEVNDTFGITLKDYEKLIASATNKSQLTGLEFGFSGQNSTQLKEIEAKLLQTVSLLDEQDQENYKILQDRQKTADSINDYKKSNILESTIDNIKKLNIL